MVPRMSEPWDGALISVSRIQAWRCAPWPRRLIGIGLGSSVALAFGLRATPFRSPLQFNTCEGSAADFDGDGCVNIADLFILISNLGPCPGATCVWDVNGDGVIDVADLWQVILNHGPCEGCPEDVDGDGVVDTHDVLAVLTHFGPCPSPPPVPRLSAAAH